MKVPRVMNWSLGVQHKLDAVTTLDVAYVGSSAANLSRTLNLNQLPVGTLQKNPGVNANALRPYPGYGNINMYVTGSNSIYNSMQVQVKRQMHGGGLLNLSYTWSQRHHRRQRLQRTARWIATTSRASAGWPPTTARTSLSSATSIRCRSGTTGREWYKKALGGWQIPA